MTSQWWCGQLSKWFGQIVVGAFLACPTPWVDSLLRICCSYSSLRGARILTEMREKRSYQISGVALHFSLSSFGSFLPLDFSTPRQPISICFDHLSPVGQWSQNRSGSGAPARACPVSTVYCTLLIAPVPACFVQRSCPAWSPVACLQILVLLIGVP